MGVSRREKMAPFMQDDSLDFVGTLSDNDDLPDEDDLVSASAFSASSTTTTTNKNKPQQNGKRKRNGNDEGEKNSLPQPESNDKNSVKKQKKTHHHNNGEERDNSNNNNDANEKDSDVDSDFEFGLENDGTADLLLEDFDGWAGKEAAAAQITAVGAERNVDVNAIVARRKGKAAAAAASAAMIDEEEEEEEEGDSEDDNDVEEFDGFGAGADMQNGADDPERNSASDSEEEDGGGEVEEEEEDSAEEPQHLDNAASESGSEDEEDTAEEERRNAFFAPETPASTSSQTTSTFHSLSLSRPILKGLAEMRFTNPTPIQAKAIPVALEGKDVVGGAVTGSGKTAAFMIPILERLLFRPKRTATTRVAILMPTRELALQCFNVAKKLASHTDITFGQAIGGLNLREQEKQLKSRPDIVIATPGRFIDLERNSSSFAVNTIEILVLDEADRMLEEGFADELNEILTKIPKSRQTMLFSATMTSKVDDLIRVGLQRPVRIMVDAQRSTVSGLVQEFIRLRPGRDTKRLGYLLHLCTEVYTERVIIFFRQKKEAHRVRIIFALCDRQAAELHGSMSQQQRLDAIEAFRTGKASYLLATDLASRGLDIKGIETVINYEAPQSHEIYLHRVGRTARAGRTGRSCTLAAEPDRKVVKAAVKAAKAQKGGAQIRQRTVEPRAADAWQDRIDALHDEIEEVLREEREEKAMATTERDLARADNIVAHKEEILARPKKTWFETEAEKLAAKKKGAEALNGPSSEMDGRGKGTKGKKLSNKQKKKLQDKDDRRAGLEWKKGKTDRGRNVGSGSAPTSAKKKQGNKMKGKR